MGYPSEWWSRDCFMESEEAQEEIQRRGRDDWSGGYGSYWEDYGGQFNDALWQELEQELWVDDDAYYNWLMDASEVSPEFIAFLGIRGDEGVLTDAERLSFFRDFTDRTWDDAYEDESLSFLVARVLLDMDRTDDEILAFFDYWNANIEDISDTGIFDSYDAGLPWEDILV